MSSYGLRIVVEKVDLKDTDLTLSREEMTMIEVKEVKSIMDLGLRHGEQIALLEKIQTQLLNEQSPSLKSTATQCGSCGSKLCNNGYGTSKFHSVFTDHIIRVQKQKCTVCGQAVTPSVRSLLGTSVHPDLSKLQCEQGANNTYRKAEKHLEQMSNKRRSVNNHMNIKDITNQVGGLLSEKNKVELNAPEVDSANALIAQVDGGHIKTTQTDKRSIEVMAAKIYRPENVIEITERRSEIQERSCVASAKQDKQASMKKYVYVAALYQGLSADTHVIGLADGAKNCWGIIQSLEKHCKELTCILDWFHLAKKFEPVIKSAPERTSQSLSQIKKHLWHFEVEEAMELLAILKETAPSGYKSKINGIYTYVTRNKDYLTDYNYRAENRLVYTSQVAESTVEHLISD